jgi:hypothetical protein
MILHTVLNTGSQDIAKFHAYIEVTVKCEIEIGTPFIVHGEAYVLHDANLKDNLLRVIENNLKTKISEKTGLVTRIALKANLHDQRR